MSYKVFSATLLLVCLVSVFGDQVVPIPQVYPGISFGASEPLLHLEAFFDLTCPDSRDAHAILLQVFQRFNPLNSKYFRFTIHLFPLPYHRNAQVTARVARYVNSTLGKAAFFKYVTDFFANAQDNYTNPFTANSTDYQINTNLAALSSSLVSGLITPGQFESAINDRSIELQVRGAWKYGCSRGITGTPIFLANGVIVQAAENFKYDDWIAFISQYVPTPEKKKNLPLRK
eukprot:TRINITY_DN24673_c0_g1_i1.p1 TRINITY_DN24673_c0_g1~~TRINITY_DN24673_c0_g1_i1.p1  ORF type:complete len:231 (+),score=43.82 TRINITY_DN24673_c0_g1_i1:128-820(+)